MSFASSLQPGSRQFMVWPAAAMALLCAAIIGAFVSSCSRKANEPVMFTGRVVDQGELRQQLGFLTFCGKGQYAEVSSAWLAWAYQDFRAEMSAGQYGVQKWDDRAECTFFATSFEAFCQKRYFAQAWHSRIPAPGIAVGTVWYLRDANNGHAINVIRCETGVRYFEPQTGQFLTLTAEQAASSYLRKFD